MSKCKITGKTLAIQLGRDETRIALINNGTEILYRTVVATPMGAVDDGVIRNVDAVHAMLKSALSVPEFKRVRQAVFVLCTTQVIAETVTTPEQPESRLEKLLQANVDTYFPVNTQDYHLIWQVIGPKESNAGLKELNVQLWAVPTQIVSRYYAVANACGLSVVAMDYCGHSIASAVGATFASPAKKAAKDRKKADAMQSAEVTADPFDTPDTNLHITLERDFLGMTFVQNGQVQMQRFIRCGRDPGQQFSELFMILEYYRGLDCGRGSSITGFVTGTLAWDNDMVSDLQGMLGMQLRVPGADAVPQWAMCVGAVSTTMDFGVPALNKPSKTRKQVQSHLWQYGLILVGGLALMGAVLLTLSTRLVRTNELNSLESAKQTLTVKMQQTAGFADNYKKYQSAYNNYSADWDTVFSSLQTYNDNLVLVLEELEERLPGSTSVTNLQIAPDGITVQFACENKEVAAFLIMTLRQMKYADIVSISNLSGGGSGPADSYGPDGYLGKPEAPPTEGNGYDYVDDIGKSIQDMISSELSEEEVIQLALSMSPEEYALLEQVYGYHMPTKYAALADLKAAYADADQEKFFQHRCNALREMLNTNPFAINRFVELLKEDFRRDEEAILWWFILEDVVRLQKEGAFGNGSFSDPDVMRQYMNVLLDVMTKDEPTLNATEALLCTDESMEKWYVYYLEAELGLQPKTPLPYLNMEKIVGDVLKGGFETGSETLNEKLNGLLSQEAWDKIDKMTSAEGMEEMFNAYLEAGTTGDPEMDALIKQYLTTGTTGVEEVDKIINDYVDSGKIDEKLADVLDKYLTEGTTGNGDLDKLINEYLKDGGTGNGKLDGIINEYLASDEMEKMLGDMFEEFLTKGTTGSATLDTFLNSYLEKGTTGSGKLDDMIADYISGGSMNDKLADLLEKYAKDGSTGNPKLDALIKNYLEKGTTGNPALDAAIEDYISEAMGSFTQDQMMAMVQNYLKNGTTGNKLYDILLKKYMETGSTGIPKLDALIEKFMGGSDDPTPGYDKEQIKALIQKYMKDGTTGVPFYDNLIDKYLKYGSTGVEELDKMIEEFINEQMKSISQDELKAMLEKYMKDGTTGNKLYDKLINKYMYEGTTGIPALDALIEKAIKDMIGKPDDKPNDQPGNTPGGNGGNTQQPADTRTYLTISFAYNEELKKAELDRKGLDYNEKIGALEVNPK